MKRRQWSSSMPPPLQPCFLGDFCQMYLRILIKSTDFIRDYEFLSRLLSSHEICLQLFGEGAHQWTSCIFFPRSLLGIIWKKKIVYPLKCLTKTKQTCFCLTHNILSHAFSSKLSEFVSVNQAPQVYTKQYIKQKQNK